MCNGYRHHPGCECGFGPRYLDPSEPLPPPEAKGGDSLTGVIRERKREKWAFKSVIDKNKMASGLRKLGLKPRWFNKTLKKYHEEGYPIRESLWNELSKNQQRGAALKMMRLLGIRQEIVEELEPIDLEIPLFRLQPPRTENSKVIYQEKQTRARGWNIFVNIPGVVIGADFSMRLETKGKIEAFGDECKVIVLPVSIKRYLVNVFIGNVCVARNKLIAEAGNKKTGQVYRRTIISCNDFISPSINAPLIADYNLNQSRTNCQFGFGWGQKAHRHAKFTIPIPNVSPGIDVEVELESELLLDFDLSPGHDYQLYPIPAGMGISWIVN